jgi:hypothetical protein
LTRQVDRDALATANDEASHIVTPFGPSFTHKYLILFPFDGRGVLKSGAAGVMRDFQSAP